MALLLWLNPLGYSLGFLGIALLVWSLLQQGVSLLGLLLLTLGFLLLVFADFYVYFL
jgi:hypothetical protein